MFAIDPSEARETSTLPRDAITRAAIVPGLEDATGADILISPLDEPVLKEITDSALSQAKLRTHCEVGMLVQRKSGSDVLHFITDHHHIFAKMRKWVETPWLLISGQFECSDDGNLLINGRLAGNTKPWDYFAFRNSLDSWQLQGGLISDVPHDDIITAWVGNAYKRLRDGKSERVIAPRKPSLRITIAGESETPDDFAIRILSELPGIGTQKAIAINKYCGSLVVALSMITDPTSEELATMRKELKGILGPTIIANIRHIFGLKSGGTDFDQWHEVFTTCAVFPNRSGSARYGQPMPRKETPTVEEIADPPPWN